MKTVLGQADDRDLRLHIAGCARCQKAIDRLEATLRAEADSVERYPFELQPQAGPQPQTTARKRSGAAGRTTSKSHKAGIRRKTK